MGANTLKTVFFMTVLTLLFMAVGGLLGGRSGMMLAFVLAFGMNMFSYWFSDKIVLKMYKAKEISETEAPELYNIVKRLTIKGNLPMPKVYIIQSPNPNAFATGRNPDHAAVAVTTGVLRLLDNGELEGVLGHELAHVKGRDILIGTIAATFAGAIMMLANMAKWAMIFGGFRDNDNRNPLGMIGVIVAMVLAPMAAMLVQMAISRSREYIADQRGANLSGNPLALASALEKISSGVKKAPLNANQATAHMFIMNPLSGKKNMVNLFSTHPPVEERIRRLNEQAKGL